MHAIDKCVSACRSIRPAYKLFCMLGMMTVNQLSICKGYPLYLADAVCMELGDHIISSLMWLQTILPGAT